jgi:hypothetical protein
LDELIRQLQQPSDGWLATFEDRLVRSLPSRADGGGKMALGELLRGSCYE